MYMDDIKLFGKSEKRIGNPNIDRIYNHDIRMGFVIDKCAMFVMKSGKRHLPEEIEQPNQEEIRTLEEKEI